MAYLASRRGDGYGVARRRGDPFLPALIGAVTTGASLIGKIGKIIKPATKLVKMPAALPALSLGSGFVAGRETASTRMPRLGPGVGGGKRRRMNVANPKALKRAIRRQAGFIKLARRTLQGTGFKIARTGLPKGAQKRRR